MFMTCKQTFKHSPLVTDYP